MTPDALQQALERIPILTYHKVDPRHEIGINSLSPEKFLSQLQYLHENGYRTVTFQDILADKNLPNKPVILSFDDAYESVFNFAAPLMQQFDMRGVVFVISGFVGKANIWDANLGGMTFNHMNDRQLKNLVAEGWEIGAHTVTHRSLVHLSRKSALKECLCAKDMLEQKFVSAVVAFAYPFGQHSDAAREIVASAGYKFACAGAIPARTSPKDLLRLPRYSVYQFESSAQLPNKLKLPFPPASELLKLRLLNFPARLTPYFQRLFKQELFTGNYFPHDLYS